MLGLPLYALLQPFKGRLISIYDSHNGEIHAKVLPGNYTVRVYLGGDLAGEKSITLKPYENLTVKIPIKVVFIQYFSISPVLGEKNTFLGVTLHVFVKNVYKTISDAKMVLKVYRNGEIWDERELISSSILPLGRQEYKFDYLPGKK